MINVVSGKARKYCETAIRELENRAIERNSEPAVESGQPTPAEN